MNRRRWTFVAAMLAAAGLWVVISSASRAGKQPAVTASPPADEPVVAASEPSPRPIAVPAALAAPAPEQPAAASARPQKEDDPHRPFALIGETEADRATRARERSELDERWKKEAQDAAWAGESGGRITQLLTEESLSPAALRAVDCRQSICRFELASSSGTDKEVMGLIHAARRLHLETWLYPQAQDDGTWRMEVFFPKEGYRLSGGGSRNDETKQVQDAPDLHVTEGASKVEG